MLKYPAVKVQLEGWKGGCDMRVRRVVSAGSSVEVSRSGTRDSTGYTVVVDDFEAGREEGELTGVRRCERCLDAADRNLLEDSRGDGAGLAEGQFITKPPASDDG